MNCAIVYNIFVLYMGVAQGDAVATVLSEQKHLGGGIDKIVNDKTITF